MAVRCECLDSPRYRALGNALAVPVAYWIGRRILEADRRLFRAAQRAGAAS